MHLIFHVVRRKIGLILLGLGFFIEAYAGENLLGLSHTTSNAIGFAIIAMAIGYEIIFSVVKQRKKRRDKRLHLLYMLIREINYIERQVNHPGREIRQTHLDEYELFKQFPKRLVSTLVRDLLKCIRDYDNVHKIKKPDRDKKERDDLISHIKAGLMAIGKFVSLEAEKLSLPHDSQNLEQLEHILEEEIQSRNKKSGQDD